MVSLETVRAENAQLKQKIGSGSVAVFVGGTSGIGEHTLRAFVKHTDAANVYVVGRNETAASKILAELQAQNSTHNISFIKADVSQLRNVDTACEEIKSKEKKINFLFLSPGILAMKGRDDTPEHIPRKLALHYYSRFRFTQQLLPLLTTATDASSSPAQAPRVLSVLAAGYEDTINTSDLALQKSYSMRSCAAHATTMNSLAVSHLANLHPGISFVHSHPGGVKTPLGGGDGFFMRIGKTAAFAVAGLFLKISEPEESGERHLWALTSDRFPATAAAAATKEQSVASIDTKTDTTAHLISPDGEKAANHRVLDPLFKDGWASKVWEHTIGFNDHVVKTGSAAGYVN